MNSDTMLKLEYDKIKERLSAYAMSHLGREHIERMEPLSEMRVIERLLNEVEEAKAIMAGGTSVPIPSLEGIGQIMDMMGTGYIFTEHDFTLLGKLLENTEQLKRFMARKETVAPNVSSYALSLNELKNLRQEIERCIRHGQVTDHASKELARIRKKMAVADERIKKKLEGAMQKYRNLLQDHVISLRGDRYVLPVKKEYRKLVPGAVLDESSSGQTVFIEPGDVAVLQQELAALRMEEAREELKVLGFLTELAEANRHEISVNLETIGYYDFLIAKAKYALAIDGRTVPLNPSGVIRIAGGKHPLLGSGTVPLDFGIGTDYKALIITGPNTGGKTVSLKTIGLLTMMVQSGLHVPVQEGSTFAVFTDIVADIGDGQSIEQSLSTFSSHIKNIIRILDAAGPSTLVLLDELAAGTDPGEGIGLSIAVLEELYKRKATVVATTHFNEIKTFAEITPGFQNARMEFDVETLQPLYRLRIGEAGQSYAFYIAQKLGVSADIIERSKQITSMLASAGAAPPAFSGTELHPPLAGREHFALQSGVKAGSEQLAPQHDPECGSALRRSPDDGQSPGTKANGKRKPFAVGDCVWIHSLKRAGIVCTLPDERGNVTVMIQKEKVKINAKRLSLYIERSRLYPGEQYDMDIVFEPKDVRKKRKLMSRKHVEGLTIVRREEQE